MKLKIKHFDAKIFESKMEHLKDINFTLFVDDIPQSQDELTDLNILVLQEPNIYFGLHDWAIQNQNLFSLILTWDDKVLNNCDNARFLAFGHTWFTPHFYNKNYEKKFQVSHLAGKLQKTYGHGLRHELLARQNEIKPTKVFHHTYGDRNNIEDARIGKVDIFAPSQYGVAIENTQHRGYFTEKILDLFLLKTIPIYWGCSNIRDFFNPQGIIYITSVDEAIHKINNVLDADYYNKVLPAIEENHKKALKYVDYEQNIVDYITKIFTENGLLAL